MFETLTMDEIIESASLGDTIAGMHVMKVQKTSVQSVVFSKSKWSAEEARSWLSDHEFKSEDMDETSVSFRFRQFEPGRCQQNSFRTISLTDGCSAVICRKKSKSLVDGTLKFLLDNLDVAEYRQTFEDLVRKGEPFAVRRASEVEIIDADDEHRILTATITNERKDRYGDVVRATGMDNRDFRRNPVVLWMHNPLGLPIARGVKEWMEGTQVFAQMKFDSAPFARDVYRLYREKYLNAFSIGFLPTEYARMYEGDQFTGYDFKSWQLLEYSAVTIPANPDALQNAYRKGLITDIETARCIGDACPSFKEMLDGEETALALLNRREQVREQLGEVVKSCASPMGDALASIGEQLLDLKKQMQEMHDWMISPTTIDSVEGNPETRDAIDPVPDQPPPETPQSKSAEDAKEKKPIYVERDVEDIFRRVTDGAIGRMMGRNGDR